MTNPRETDVLPGGNSGGGGTPAALPAVSRPDSRTHKPGCECLEFGCTAGIKSHGCTCPGTAARQGDRA
jgi:hypothetical protein